MRLTHGLLALSLLLSACPSGDDDDDSSGNNGGAGQSGSGAQAGKGGGQCDQQGCLACFNASTMDGADCQDECKGCDDDASSGSGGSNADPGGKQPECSMDHECGISQECLACGLTDTEGWCFFTKECKFDDDCGTGNKCGYNVVSSDYRCLPAATCESE